jgi:hypothetical protein
MTILLLFFVLIIVSVSSSFLMRLAISYQIRGIERKNLIVCAVLRSLSSRY